MTPAFRKLWLGRSVSFVGSEITLVALPLAAVLLLEADAREMGWLVAAQNLPMVFFGLVAGVWVDRSRRQPMLVATNFGQAALLAAIPAAAYFDSLSLWLIGAVGFGANALSIIGSVADRAYLPSLLARDQLVGGNSRIQLSFSLARTVGPGAAGLLVQWLTAPVAILVDVVTFLFAGTLIGSIRHEERLPARTADLHAFAGILEGIRRVVRDAVLRPLVLCGATHNVCTTAITALYVLYLTRTLGLSPTQLGAILAAGGLGAVLGSLTAPRLTAGMGIGPTLIVSQAFTGLARLLIPLAAGPLPAVIATLAAAEFLLGGMRAIFNVTQISLRQTVTEPAYQGRVNATVAFLLWALAPLGAIGGGLLGDAIGIEATLWIAAGGVLAATGFAYFSALRTTRTA